MTRLATTNITEGKKVDQQRLENLYIDYKKNQIKKRHLKVQVEKEEGVTFKPKLLIDENYVPKHDFYERNDILLAEKKLNVELRKKAELENLIHNRTYSPEEKKYINQNIQERLYKPAVQKLLIKGKLRENQFSRRKYIENQNNYTEIDNPDIGGDINNNQIYVNNFNVINVIDSSERNNNRQQHRDNNNSNTLNNTSSKGNTIQNNQVNSEVYNNSLTHNSNSHNRQNSNLNPSNQK